MSDRKRTARQWVHRYAAAGAGFAVLPLPVTSTGLATLELYLCRQIASIYGTKLGAIGTVAVGGGLGIASPGLKWLATRVSDVLPIPGVLVRAGIAAGAIELMGHAAIEIFERVHGAQGG